VYVIGHGTETVEQIGVRHRTKIARALGHLFVIAMQISENRLELAHHLRIRAFKLTGMSCKETVSTATNKQGDRYEDKKLTV
jgi:threonine dehydrogenase-like Zn-dependent dehydrogenase